MNVASDDHQQPILSVRGLSKIYGTGGSALHALKNIDLDILSGSFTAIMGHSGSGKSTMLNILGCLDSPTTGSYDFKSIPASNLQGEDRARLRRHYFGFVFQGFNLLEHSSAFENVCLPMMYRRTSRRERTRSAFEALESVGLLRWRDHLPSQMSGGQQQRVAIARAIVTKPMLLFADEPTGNLDHTMSHEIMNLMQTLNNKLGITIVMVTHDTEVADYASRRIVFHDGQIAEDC